jgi:phosphoserine aminotransferase
MVVAKGETDMVHRVHNFNPGPATLPLPVLQRVQEEFLDYQGTGMSIMESSHRSPEFDAVNNQAVELLKELMEIPEGYSVAFLQGGASLQFAMAPMNFLTPGTFADYLITGTWSKKALKEANIVGEGRVAGSSEEANFTRIPSANELKLDEKAQFVHITSNNTIAGTQWHQFPDTGKVPLVCDASSDILSRRMDVSKFGIIYAGAQKNLGPSGVTVVVIRDDLVEKGRTDIPTLLQYRTQVSKKSLYNTPNSFGIYFLKCYLDYVKEQGGVPAVEKINEAKQALLYQAIDGSDGFYRGTVEKEARSWMNVTVRIKDDALEAKFIAEAKADGLVGLKGHRSVGGIRASIYNAMPMAGVEALVAFMKTFQQKNG